MFKWSRKDLAGKADASVAKRFELRFPGTSVNEIEKWPRQWNVLCTTEIVLGQLSIGCVFAFLQSYNEWQYWCTHFTFATANYNSLETA